MRPILSLAHACLDGKSKVNEGFELRFVILDSVITLFL